MNSICFLKLFFIPFFSIVVMLINHHLQMFFLELIKMIYFFHVFSHLNIFLFNQDYFIKNYYSLFTNFIMVTFQVIKHQF